MNSRDATRTTSDELSFPILLHSSKFHLLKFKERPNELIWEKGSLKRLEHFVGVQVFDNQLRNYEILGIHILRGHGLLWGYFVQGPFLCRNIVFRADVSFREQRNLSTAFEVLVGFIKRSQSLNQNDIARFHKAFSEFLPTAEHSLNALWSFYTAFKWGDDLDKEDDE